ncbi:glycine/betaine ABC transporter [Prolixibacter bellariivorans]|uniref:Glycine/betaine ABC transporter n=2 Tax=Prolixibacter bellariivorans TaxID=314319 RepID=A0A5M4B2U4_9BACT|nr:glycine/betaine ABC transporter [Prolixibacter bellariivorans]
MHMNLLRKLTIISAVALMLTSCGGSKKKNSEKGAQKKITIAMVNWSECIADTHLAKVALEAHGYKVDLVNADVAPVFAAVAKGDANVFMEVWGPITHKPYLDKFGDKIEKLGTIYKDGRLGLVVPDYVTIDSINQLNEYKDKFDGKIIGINPGAGIMKITQNVIKDYNLDYELVTSSEAGMLASLKKAYDKKEWVVVTGWKPHTMFAKWKLKILKDPKKVMGNAESISTYATKGWAAKNPEAATFFSNFKMNDDLLGSLMLAVEAAPGKEDQAAQKWYEDHKELVDGWFKKQAN